MASLPEQMVPGGRKLRWYSTQRMNPFLALTLSRLASLSFRAPRAEKPCGTAGVNDLHCLMNNKKKSKFIGFCSAHRYSTVCLVPHTMCCMRIGVGDGGWCFSCKAGYQRENDCGSVTRLCE